MKCPDDEVLLRFVANEAPPEERLRVVRHLVVCRDCRELSAMIARLWKLSALRSE